MSIKRGDIYFVDLNPVKGREQRGRRPVLVISSDSINALPLVITVIVGTSGTNIKRDYPTSIRVAPDEENHLPRETVFMAFQIRSLDPARFPREPVGQLKSEDMQRVDEALRLCLNL